MRLACSSQIKGEADSWRVIFDRMTSYAVPHYSNWNIGYLAWIRTAVKCTLVTGQGGCWYHVAIGRWRYLLRPSWFSFAIPTLEHTLQTWRGVLNRNLDSVFSIHACCQQKYRTSHVWWVFREGRLRGYLTYPETSRWWRLLTKSNLQICAIWGCNRYNWGNWDR